MRITPLLCLLGLAAACYQGHDGPAAPTTVAGDTLRIVGGPLVLDSLAQTEFRIAGPRVLDVSAAWFLSHDAPREQLPATVGLRRFTGDSGVVLQATLVATGAVRAGVYDLVLASPRSATNDSTWVVAGALRVTRAWTPRGGGPPPPDSTTVPGPSGGPAPTPPPTTPPTPSPYPYTYGTLRVNIVASGPGVPASFTLHTSGGSSYADDDAEHTVTGTSGEWVVSTGAYVLYLVNLPNQCARPAAVNAVVVKDSTTTVTIAVTCSAPAFVRVNVTFSGSPPGAGFSAYCSLVSCGAFPPLQSNGSVTLQPVAVPQPLVLVPPFNCTANVASPVTITPVAGQTIDVDVALTCLPYTGTLRVVVHAPPGVGPFAVAYGYEGCYRMYDCDGSFAAAADQVVEREVPMGRYDVAVWRANFTDLPANCSLAVPNPAVAEVTGGGSTLVAIDVLCN